VIFDVRIRRVDLVKVLNSPNNGVHIQTLGLGHEC
jgi:hypothetical protein